MQPVIAFGWGQSNSWAAGHPSVTQNVSRLLLPELKNHGLTRFPNQTLAHAAAIQGATVVLLSEKGTSRTCSARFPVLQAELPVPLAAAYHPVTKLEMKSHRCLNDLHV